MKHETCSTGKQIGILLVFILPSFYFMFFGSVFAAETPRFYFEGLPSRVFGVGSELSIKVLVDSPFPLNAFSFALRYPKEQLTVSSVSEAQTILDVRKDWPESPFSSPLKFSGASFKSFEGERGLVATIILRTIQPGKIHLEILDPSVYLADGKGTEISLEGDLLDFEIREGAEVYDTKGGDDKALPVVQEFSLVSDPIYNDKKLATFLVRDNESGIRETFVRTRQWFFWDEWRRATNPVAIKKGVWTASLRVIDNSGNVSERIVYDWLAFGRNILPLFGIASVVLLLVINKLLRKKRL